MLLPLFAVVLLHSTAIAAPFTQSHSASNAHEPWWTRFVHSLGDVFGLRTFQYGSPAAELGLPQSGDGWFWNLNGWSLAESELSVVDQEPVQTFVARPALFGSHIVTSPGLLGHLLPLNSFTVHDNTSSDYSNPYHTVPYPLSKDNTGCPPLRIPKGHPQPSMNESWIALVVRGECSFDEKIRQAQRLGARAAVVGGKSPGPNEVDELISMSSASDSRDITIPAVYVTHATYQKLLGLILASNMSTSGLRTVSVVMGPEETWAWWSPILSFAILLLLPSIMTLITLFVHRVRAARHAARQRAPGDVVRALPIRVWTGTGWICEKDWIASHPHGSSTPSSPPIDESSPALEDAEGVPQWFASQGECAICLSSFARGDRVRVLPCSHVFHVEEVDGWLLNRRKVCPICKADVTHPAPRSIPPRVFPVVVHPADAGNRTSAGSGGGVLQDNEAVGSGSGATAHSSVPEQNERWWLRAWHRVQGRRQPAATERTPLLSS